MKNNLHKFTQFLTFFLWCIACQGQHEGKGESIRLIEQDSDIWYRTPPTALDYVGRGKYYFQQQLFIQAMAALNQALLLDAQLAEAYLWRGKTKEALKDYSGAINDYNMALYYNKQLYEAHILRAGIRFIHGDSSGACQECLSVPIQHRSPTSPCAKICQGY